MIRRKKICCNLLFVCLCLLFAVPIQAEVSLYLESYCAEQYAQEGVCDENVCAQRCLGDLVFEGCPQECVAKTCLDLSIANCPKDACEILEGCSGDKTCYFKIEDEGMRCGSFAYAGKRLECCEGFQRRCGDEYFDGSCGMGEGTMSCVPICIPCGDGVCGVLENKCNCPEDCSGEVKNIETLEPVESIEVEDEAIKESDDFDWW